MPEPKKVINKLGKLKLFQKIRPLQAVNDRLEIGREDKSYGYNGEARRYNEIYSQDLKGQPIVFLINLKKKSPKIMVIGPGVGLDLIVLTRELSYFGIEPQLDVFGLTKTISTDAQKVVRTDYSQSVALETIGSDPEKYSELINAVQGVYDLVIGSNSVGFHTNYPAHNCFYSAMMLNVGGEAYIDVYLGIKLLKKTMPNVLKHVYLTFQRLVAAYNKVNRTNYKFELKIITPGSLISVYFKIKRIQ